MNVIAILFGALFYIVIMFIVIYSDHYNYNNGIHRKCGGKWIVDSTYVDYEEGRHHCEKCNKQVKFPFA